MGKFAGEILVDHSAVGLAAFIGVIAFQIPGFRGARAPAGRLEYGCGAAAAALLAVAPVDFPLRRPAELYLLWTLLALSQKLARREDSDFPPAGRHP